MWNCRVVLDKKGKPFFVGVKDGKMIDWSIRLLYPERALPEEEYKKLYLS